MTSDSRKRKMDLAGYRRKYVTQARRIVVKVGSGVLTAADGLDSRLIGRLAGEVSAVKAQGREVVLVSSGAIAAGFRKMGFPKRPTTVRQQQACAAVGQAGLMMTWEKAFERRGHKVAQVLLTAEDLANRQRYLNSRNTLTTLIEWNIIPIINENDTVVVAEIKFGDNDTLGSLVAGLIEADLFINLTDLDGLYDADPRQNPDARFLPLVENVGAREESMASGIPGSLGAGGMYTKILAARRLARHGVASIIAGGSQSAPLTRILSGEPLGTLFLPRTRPLKSRKHWLAFTAKPRGRLVVDEGARQALLEKGKSLLPSGVVEVVDRFSEGDPVQVVDLEGRVVAVGLTNYSSDELRLLAGCHTREIETRLGYRHSDEIIHRDNMVVGDDLRA
jgi:glutamate 5-kinase